MTGSSREHPAVGSKHRTLLRWLAGGAALGAVSSLAVWAIRQASSPEAFYVLAYSRNTGPSAWADKITKDPAPAVEQVSDYPVQIAARCKLPRWSIGSNMNVSDVDETAWLRVNADDVEDKMFNCLSEYVRPPFVRLRRGSEPAMGFGE